MKDHRHFVPIFSKQRITRLNYFVTLKICGLWGGKKGNGGAGREEKGALRFVLSYPLLILLLKYRRHWDTGIFRVLRFKTEGLTRRNKKKNLL